MGDKIEKYKFLVKDNKCKFNDSSDNYIIIILGIMKGKDIWLRIFVLW